MDLKPTRTSSDCGVSLWGFLFNWCGVLWFQLVGSFISDFLGGVLFSTHYLRWGLLLSRFRIIILKASGAAKGPHHRPQHGPEKIIVLGVYGEGGAVKLKTAAQNECSM